MMQRILIPVTVLLAFSVWGCIQQKEGPAIPQRRGADGGAKEVESRSAKPRRLLLIWLMDESPGMKRKRDLFLAKFKGPYGMSEANEEARRTGRIRSAVCGFGTDFHVLMEEPTTDPDEVRKAMASIPEDAKGKENTLTAVRKALKEYAVYGRKYNRRIVIILVTDEAGDDDDPGKTGADSPLERTLTAMKRHKAELVVLGARAGAFAFPKEQTYDPTVPKGISPYAWLDRGTDSALDEMLPCDHLLRRTTFVPSGFGPYALSRLSHETGGVYHLLEEPKHAYDYEKLLAGYEPELVSRKEIAERNERSELRKTLMKIIADWKALREERSLRSYFGKDEEGRRQIEECLAASEGALKLVQRHIASLAVLDKVMGRHSPKRWQANRDLVWAQLHKHRFQLRQYGRTLRNIIDRKDLPPADRIGWLIDMGRVGPLRADDLEEAIKEKTEVATLFHAVVDQHADTPWALYAMQEIKSLGGYVVDPWPRKRGNPQTPHR